MTNGNFRFPAQFITRCDADMGQVANILDARKPPENPQAPPRTARLIPGARRNPRFKAAGSTAETAAVIREFESTVDFVLPAILREFSPDALGIAVCDAGIVAIIFVLERLALHVYLPVSTFCFFLIGLSLFGTSEGLYAAPSVSLKQSVLALAKSVAATTLLICLGQAAGASPDLAPRSLLLSAYSLCALCAFRQLRHAVSHNAAAPIRRRIVIVGQGAHARHLANVAQSSVSSGVAFCGFISDSELSANGIEVLAAAARRKCADEIVIATEDPDLREAVAREAMRNRLDVCIALELGEIADGRPQFSYFYKFPVLKVTEDPPRWGLAIKRMADAALAGSALIVLSPLLVVMAALVWLDSRGPVLYLSTRVGRKGAPFTCYKFRTMVPDAEKLQSEMRAINDRSGAFFKIVTDPRVTRVGRVLRRYSLDELPQLWNVVRGEMSLVGPRPHPLDDVKLYRLEHLQRLDFVPGMTGLWQVTARNDPSFEHSVELDRQYICGWNLWLDLKILLKTCRVVLQGSGM